MNRLFTLILLVSASFLFAINPSDLYQELINKYGQVETFQADLQQTSYYSEIDYTNISQGKIYYNPNNIFIEYTSPKAEKISLSDDLVKIYQVEPDRMIMTYADSSFVSLNMKYLIERIWNDELVELTEDESYYIVKVELTEQNSIANIENIEFAIDKKEKIVQKVKYLDNSANEVQVLFSNIRLNEALPDNFWEIETTENTQIIDYRE